MTAAEQMNPSRRGKSKRRVVRAAFVVTATLVAAAAGCDSSVQDGTTITNPPAPECPASAPSDGDACGDPNTCSYPDACGQEMLAKCEGLTWQVDPPGSCNPPPPCPNEMPAEGEACDITPGGVPVDCAYELATACGPTSVPVQCMVTPQGGYVWHQEPPACTPTTPNCGLYTGAAACDADTTCRWLVPGCGDPGETFEAGCYPADDCTPNSCGLDQACTSVTYDPCWNSNCDACGASANVCQASMGGA